MSAFEAARNPSINELDAAVGSGKVVVDREDIAKPNAEVRHIRDQVNRGGKHIEAHSDAGTIVIR